MKTKLVTGYWMGISDAPWFGAQDVRKDRYLGSLISHCKGFPECEIVCYTHRASLREVQEVKELFQLDNLTVKVKELTEMSFHPQIQSWRDNGKTLIEQFPETHGRTPEVMWGKFEVLKQELTGSESPCDKIYWIDVGLQHPGIFPWRYCPVRNEPNFNMVPYKQWNFTTLLNQSVIDKANEITTGKLITLVGTDGQNQYYVIDGHNFRPQAWPIAGFFGGDPKVVEEYCDLFKVYSQKHLDNDIVCVEQAIMKYVNDVIVPEKLIEFTFQSHGHSGFKGDYHEDQWVDYETTGLKPLYVCWQDILTM